MTVTQFSEHSLLDKVQSFNERSFVELVSAQKPFGLRTFFTGAPNRFPNSIKIYTNRGISYVSISEINNNREWVQQHKVYISMAYGAGEGFPHQIINRPIYGGPNTCCTETYLVVGPFNNQVIATNVRSYVATKFFRFLVLLRKNTQHAAQGVYQFVPIQEFTECWTDEMLYVKYGLATEEISFIESMIRPMDLSQNGGEDE